MHTPSFHQLTLWLLLVSISTLSCSDPTPEPIRILTGGIRHESNTFVPILTTENEFSIERGMDALQGEDWAQYLQEAQVEIIPTLHVNASPFGVVAQSTYEAFKEEILVGVRAAGRLDGIFLDMHGALHAEGYPDAQADFVQSIRNIVGKDVLISGSFDLHGNISQDFVDGLNILTGYRTAPHVDGAETRLRAVTLLHNAIQNKQNPVIAHLNVPILIPGEKGITAIEPLKLLYEQLPDLALQEGLLDGSLFVGMPWTDVPRAGMSVQVVAADASYLDLAEKEVQRLAQELWDLRSGLIFDVATDDFDAAVQTARDAPEATVFITDSGDNITAGAAGDNPLVLERLLALGAEDAVVAGIFDEAAVEACEAAGVGAEVTLTVGGKLDTVFGKPFTFTGTVRSITETPSQDRPKQRPAVVEVDGVLVVLLTERRSFTSPDDFREVSIDPLAHKIVIVKLGYLFQGLRDIAPRAIMALTPGFAYQVVENLPYQNIPRPIYPIDPEMYWTPGN